MLQRTPSQSPKAISIVAKRAITKRASSQANAKVIKPRVIWKMGKRQHLALIEMLLPFMREAQPTPFAYEAPGRYRLRSKLCLQGWPWNYADQQAAAITHAVLRRLGTRRPTWIEGQQEYCHEGFLRDDLCWNCGNGLPKYAKRYCCHRCMRTAAQFRVKGMYDMMIM